MSNVAKYLKAIAQLEACESVLRSDAGTEAIVYAVRGKREALRVIAQVSK
jgi:hypothetical protein